MQRFPLRRSPWLQPILLSLGSRRPEAVVDGDRVRVRMGLHGGADIPVSQVARVGRMHWPWWGGVGARIARGMVAFVARPGEVVVLELASPVRVRAPLAWSAGRVGIGVEDAEGFMAAVAEARSAAGPPPAGEAG
ncbi:hypothetical protein [Miltoncostaea marina]|uniref:hypothetical protein n=1 Tax=Miltoncostaea marina TaxID=2843215 RepID=UPI001C3DE920|nr:hypothetical protein [Miltoncostaea marina]